jgi:hypothetical protein
MANSQVASANIVTRWQKEVNREYVRGGSFGPYIGKDTNAIIQVKQGLKKVSIPLVAKISGNGVTGSQQLAGNEKVLNNYAFELTPIYYREGVLVDNEENEKGEFELLDEAKPALMNWAMELKRNHIIEGMGGVQAGGTYYNYGTASAANLDTWNGNNQDRILYGSQKSNLVAGNHTSSLATIDTTNDKLDVDIITLAKRMAKNANPIIRPYRIQGDKDYYIFWCDSYGFRDLSRDSTIAQANREARSRGLDNPIFQGGDLIYDGIIIKECEDISIFIDGDSSGTTWDGAWGAKATSGDGLDNGGNSSSRVGVGFLCGSQALGFGLGRMPSIKRRKEDDYEHQNGVGISMKHDLKKMFYNNKQHGMLTVFYSAALDS